MPGIGPAELGNRGPRRRRAARLQPMDGGAAGAQCDFASGPDDRAFAWRRGSSLPRCRGRGSRRSYREPSATTAPIRAS